MAAHPTIIDLGVVGAGPEDPPAPAGRPPGLPGWLPVAVTVLLAMLTLSAATTSPGPWLTPLPTFPGGTREVGLFHLTDETLYVFDREPDQRRTLVAYRLTDGTVRWRAYADDAYLLDGIPVLLWLDPAAGPLRTSLLDPETGTEIWQGLGSAIAITDDRLVLERHLPPAAVVETRWETSLAVVDLATGAEILSLPRVSGMELAPGNGTPATHLVVHAAGELVSYHLGTGAAQARAAAPPTAVPPHFTGDIVLVQHDRSGSVHTAYDVDTLERLWTADLGADPWNVRPCQPVLCAVDEAAGVVRLVDPRTGAPALPTPLAASEVWSQPRLPGYFVAGADGEYRLVETRTGEPVLELGAWQPHYYQPDGGAPWGALLTRYEFGPAPVVQPAGENRQRITVPALAGRTWFAELRLDPPRLEVLGSHPSGPMGCQVTNRYVACEHLGEILVSRTRTPGANPALP